MGRREVKTLSGKIKLGLLSSIFLTRPYSWIHSFLIGVLAAVIASQVNAFSFIMAGFESVLLYILLCSILETKHKEVGRPLLPRLTLLVVFVVSLLIALQTELSIAFYGGFVILSYLYSLKKIEGFGLFSFVARGLMVITQFFVIFFIFNAQLSILPVVFALALALLMSARNLIGDIRDIKTDKTTFPAVFGKRASLQICSLMLLLAAGLLAAIGSYLLASLVILLLALILFIKNAFILHRVLIVYTTIILSLALFQMLNNYLFILLIPVDALTNIYFYKKIFRKANSKTK